MHGNLQTIDIDAFRGDGSAHLPAVTSARLKRQIERMVATARSDGAYRADAVDSIIASRDVEQVLAEVLRDDFGPRYSAQYIPIGSFGVSPWAERYIQKRITPRGLLDYVTSADMPNVSVDMQEVPHSLSTMGGKFGWSYFEMQQAQFANAPLSNELAVALREAAEQTKDAIFLSGDSILPKGGGRISAGLINHPDVSIAAPVTGTWSTPATVAQIIADVMALVVQGREQTRRAETLDTLLLPEAQYGILESTQVPNTNMNIRSWLLANIAGLTSIDPLPQLSTAGATGGSRAIL
jgi:hypothetical protein